MIAAHEPPSIAELERCIGVGRAWVAVTDRDRPVGYLLAAIVDDCAHVVQVSVARAHASRRLGAALIDHLATIAGQAGQPALTLTTFLHVAWNVPYYRRLGFEVLRTATPAAAFGSKSSDSADPLVPLGAGQARIKRQAKSHCEGRKTTVRDDGDAEMLGDGVELPSFASIREWLLSRGIAHINSWSTKLLLRAESAFASQIPII